jgi:hypothetical protein
MARILSHGVKIIAVASWFDEVVPFHSAIAQNFEHPNIFRSVFIDESILLTSFESTSENLSSAGSKNPNHFSPTNEQVDFLTHLVVFILKLRNKGLSDYGLSIHVSRLISGTILSGMGKSHSSLYEEEEVYTLALSFSLNSNHLNTPLKMRSFRSPTKINPYGLTFGMARLAASEIVMSGELKDEFAELLNKFEKWEPKAENLKLARYSLEGLLRNSIRNNYL